MDAPLLRPQEAATILAVSKSELYELIRRGDIRHVRIGRRSVRLRQQDLEEYIRGSLSGGHGGAAALTIPADYEIQRADS